MCVLTDLHKNIVGNLFAGEILIMPRAFLPAISTFISDFYDIAIDASEIGVLSKRSRESLLIGVVALCLVLTLFSLLRSLAIHAERADRKHGLIVPLIEF